MRYALRKASHSTPCYYPDAEYLEEYKATPPAASAVWDESVETDRWGGFGEWTVRLSTLFELMEFISENGGKAIVEYEKDVSIPVITIYDSWVE